ncbi:MULTISPECIES: ABC transporter permease subunit [unclassified Mesorhizobium]|uniref:ABC transporter permease n=1 Tax=unclassified Mesorhizobium TaxID=325217 RepID=UPI000FCAD404|nr:MULTISPECIES: ABC transporter permease subunit [unclassified Mesorhizobium]RUW36810.1 ABC transporter permease subunit [Mesorhizobium sp. M1E.F.Ca.ET.041.01.1.1]RWD84924.1 MAG: ABC transporter permease subunit [Mesorhizobium sp.]RWD90048.1 MAG: ABC transporter permease subunit [Mesorhizobium sp.]TIV54186.1 MAG: ABC transporter permease subunit [Mesorhizobium sp.]
MNIAYVGSAIRTRQALNWLGVTPFLLFALLFLILPTMNIVIGAFGNADGDLTFDNIVALFTPTIRQAFWISIELSLLTAVLGCLFGFMIAAAITLGNLPRWLRNTVTTFSGVASNFAGVPLSFAFIATLGRLGFVTLILRDWFGVNLYASGFNLISFLGLSITYLYFQIPLMVLIITPALEGLRREWREAAEILGASGRQYWRMIALPVLWPSLLGTLALLFANAFGAVATAIALTGSSLSIVPIMLFAQIRGDVLNDPHLGYAIAFAMIALTALANAVYILLRIRAERWLK